MAWNPNESAEFSHRPGASPQALGNTTGTSGCPDLWELSNGDFAVIGRDLTDSYSGRLPSDAIVNTNERIVVIPRSTLISAAEGLRNG